MKRTLLIVVTSTLLVSAFSFNRTSFYDEAARKKITQEILDNFVKEDFDAVRKDFHSSLKTSLPADKIGEVWQSVINNGGKYISVISVNTSKVQEYNQVKMRIKFEKENATLETIFNEDDKVLGLWIKP